jgi:hypothetical protein
LAAASPDGARSDTVPAALAVPFPSTQAQFPHSHTSQVQNTPLQSGQRQSVQPHAERAVPVEAA